MVHGYKIHYKGGQGTDERGRTACFSGYTYAGNDSRKNMAGISYEPEKGRKKSITKTQARVYYRILLKEFGLEDYIDGYPTVNSVMANGIHISSELPTSSALFILTLFRYVEEIPKIVTTFLSLRKLGNELTDAQYLEWAHKICEQGIYGYNSNHSVFDLGTHTFCNGNMMEIFERDWEKEPPHSHIDRKQVYLSDLYRTKKYNDKGLQGLSASRKSSGTTFANISFIKATMDRMFEIDNPNDEDEQEKIA